jgi:hypothetical protein
MRLFVRALACASLMFAALGAPAAAQTPVLPILDHIHLNGVKITTEPVGAKIEMVQR